MAIMKYLRYSAPQYRDALEYVVYRHDEETKEPILDSNGKRMRREDFLVDGLNCTPLSFPMKSKFLNDRYRKNQEPGRELFMGQYIISYNPKDKEECLLDTRKAHELSMQYIRECFPGLVGLVCTHGDGDHHAGNIHTHFYYCTVKCSNEISSTMKYPEVAPMGHKFQPSPATRREYREKLAELVTREGLHPDNLLGIAGDRITHGEYWHREYQQKKLDEKNRQIREAGGIPEKTVYYTEKQRLRNGILDAAARHEDFESFYDSLLNNYGISLVVNNEGWRYGFRASDRSFSAITLGNNYVEETIRETLRRNREDPSRIEEYLKGRERRLRESKPDLPDPDSPGECMAYLRRKRDNPIANRFGEIGVIAAEYLDGEDRDRILRSFPGIIHFLEKRMIQTIEAVMEIIKVALHRILDLHQSLQEAEKRLREANNLRYWGSVLRRGKALRDAMESASDPQAFQKEHEGELLELHHAEKVFSKISDSSEKTLWKNVQNCLREVRDIREKKKEWQHDEIECNCIMQELEFLDRRLEKHPQLKEKILQTRDKEVPEPARRQETRSMEQEHDSRQKKYRISMDYER